MIVLFLDGNAILFDFPDNNSVFGNANQAYDGLYYIDDYPEKYSIYVTVEEETVRSYMEISGPQKTISYNESE